MNSKRLLSLLTALAMVFSLAAMVQPLKASAATQTIEISNGGFENGAFGGAITGNANASVVEKQTYEGNYAVKFDATGEVLTVTGYLPTATTAESQITLSFWAKVTAESTGNSVNYNIYTTNADWGNRQGTYAADYPTPGGDWKQITQSVTAPADTKIVQVEIFVGSENTTAIVDNVSIVDGNGSELLVSGGFERGTLSGDFNANDALEMVFTPVHSGNYAAHVVKDGDNGTTTTTVYLEPSTEARTMNLSYWMYVPTTAAANGLHNGVVCFGEDWNGVLSEVYGAQYATFGEWTQQTLDIAVAANTGIIQILLYAQDTGANVYIDDLVLTETLPAVSHPATLELSAVTDDSWVFSVSAGEPIPNGFYKIPATVDGVTCDLLSEYNNGTLTIWDGFFPALGGSKPTQTMTIAKNAKLQPMGQEGGWHEIDQDTVILSEALELVCSDGVWGNPVKEIGINLGLGGVMADGTWQFTVTAEETIPEGYYKIPATVDGVPCQVLAGYDGSMLLIYPSFFTALDGTVPSGKFAVAKNTVLKPVDSTNGWAEMDDTCLNLSADLLVEYTGGAWKDMSQYSEVSFADITASDLTVYKWEDQSASSYRSVLGISSNTVSIDSNAAWGNFTLVAGSVLVDGQKADTVFGMLPADDPGWGAENAMLLYIVGEGYRDAVTAASSVTVTAGTTLISGTDATHGYRFTEDFTMYKNCDGSWNTTADTHVYNQQNTGLEGALVSAANCQSPAVYYYSCVCGAIGTETFTYGELGEHNYVDGTCDLCGDKIAVNTEIAFTLHTVTDDGTWQFNPSKPFTKDAYYKLPVVIDGTPGFVAAAADTASGFLLIYPDFFGVFDASEPTTSMEIRSGAVLNEVNAQGWVVIENTDYFTTTNTQRVEQIGGKWFEMSQYDGVTYTEIHASDLDVYYQDILRLGDFSDSDLNMLKLADKSLYNTVQEMITAYGRQANRTTIGIKSVNPALTIPSDAAWSNFTVLGSLIVNGEAPADTYIAMTPNSASGHKTGMDNAFLLFFYNGYVLDNATSVTIPAGTRIIAKDGTTGFVFAEDYTVYRKCDTQDLDEYRTNQHTWNDTEGYHYPGQWIQTVAPAYKVPGQESTTCTKCGETLNRELPALTTPVKEWNVTLGENIGVKFILGLTGSETVTAAVNGVPVEAPVVDGVLCLNLPATQMADEIVISIDGEALAKTYSVRGYAEEILNGNYPEATKNLVKYMLAYGSAAQTYFGYNTENLADSGITVEAKTPTGETTVDYSGRVSGIAFYSASLLHRNKTAVRFYFTGSAENLTFTVNGVACEPAAKDDMYYVELAGINPQELANDVTVVVSDGTDSLTVHYSPMDYIVRMYEKETSSPQTKALVQALYGYYEAAIAYIPE